MHVQLMFVCDCRKTLPFFTIRFLDKNGLSQMGTEIKPSLPKWPIASDPKSLLTCRPIIHDKHAYAQALRTPPQLALLPVLGAPESRPRRPDGTESKQSRIGNASAFEFTIPVDGRARRRDTEQCAQAQLTPAPSDINARKTDCALLVGFYASQA